MVGVFLYMINKTPLNIINSMILLNKDISGNTITATAFESVTLSAATGDTSGYTMTITNDMSNDILADIALTDVSLFPLRYNEFEFDNSILTPLDEGLYWYDINFYVTTDGTGSTETQEVEEGILKIYSDTPIIDDYKYTGTTGTSSTFFVYENR